MPKQKPKPQAQGWRTVLTEFLRNFEIDSKELGRTKLKPWGTQQYFLDQLALGMDEGIRFFIGGKGRQYGITTIMIPIDVLWALMHPGIEGAIIGHKPDVLEVCRAQINDMQTRLPEAYKVPLTTNNKDKLEWTFRDGTKSTINLLVAGTTGRRTDLAKGHGLSFIHGTECAEWGSEVAFNSLIASLAQRNPNRLYVFESTGESANNLFARLWRKSLDDPERKTIFIPWWTHDLYRLDRRGKLYAHYMPNDSISDDEAEMVNIAHDWGHALGRDQLAWYRATCNRITTPEEVKKNYPTVWEDMFQLGGTAFIPHKPLSQARSIALNTAFTAYQIHVGADVSQMRIDNLGEAIDEDDGHVRGANLRVWQAPRPMGRYAIGVNPQDTEGCVRSIQVLRCYADCVEQVAEFASDVVDVYQTAWIAAYLAGWYKFAWLNIELEHGGGACFRELANLRNQTALTGVAPEILGSMIFYVYNRVDSMHGASHTWHWRSNATNEQELFADFKGSFLAKRLIIRSVPLCEEMTTLTQDENSVGGDDGAEDSRTRSMCIAIRTWVDHIRMSMLGENRTRQAEAQKDVNAAPASFLENIVDSFMSRQQRALREETQAPWQD